jgi:hypothetical protein
MSTADPVRIYVDDRANHQQKRQRHATIIVARILVHALSLVSHVVNVIQSADA